MISTDEIRRMLREACKSAGSQRAWAKANRVSDAYVSDVLAGRREAGESIAKPLGFHPITMYDELPRKRRRNGARRGGVPTRAAGIR